MADISVSVHELKAKLSEFLSRCAHGMNRIIIHRRNHPIAMIVPMSDGGKGGRGGLASVDWERFRELAPYLDEAYEARRGEDYREVPL